MRKMLALIGAVTLGATSSISVVSCETKAQKAEAKRKQEKLSWEQRVELKEVLKDYNLTNQKVITGVGETNPTLETILMSINDFLITKNVKLLTENDIETSSTPTATEATLKAKDSSKSFKGEFKVIYSTEATRKLVELKDAIKQITIIGTNDHPKEEDVLKGLKAFNPNLFIKDIAIKKVEKVYEKTFEATLNVASSSKNYNSTTEDIKITYKVDKRKDLSSFIQHKIVGPKDIRLIKIEPYFFEKAMEEAVPDIFNYLIKDVKKLSTNEIYGFSQLVNSRTIQYNLIAKENSTMFKGELRFRIDFLNDGAEFFNFYVKDNNLSSLTAEQWTNDEEVIKKFIELNDYFKDSSKFLKIKDREQDSLTIYDTREDLFYGFAKLYK